MGNHIDHIEIKNFKSIRHQVIDGCKRINVFIGYPNVGKSAILEAISALCYLQKDYSGPFSDLCRLDGAAELFHDGDIRQNSLIKLPKRAEVEFNYISDKEIDCFVQNYFEGNLYLYKNLKFVNKSVERKQINSIGDVIKVKKYIFRYPSATQKTNGLNLSFPYGENLVDIIQFSKDIRKEVADLFKSNDLKLLIDQATNSIRGLKQLDEETIFTIPFYQMADTLQRLIFHKAAIMSNQNSVLLFEEPEAHMFPPYISKFTNDIIYNKENGNQYFIATHSPFVLNDLIEEAKDDLSIYAVGLHNGETTIKRISDEDVNEIYQYGIDLFFNLEDYLKND